MPKRFRTATLQSDGTAVVTGPFTLEPGDPQKPALVAFYLVQESSSGDGEPNYTTVEGDGRWSVGDEEWTGTCDGALLKAGTAWGYGMAILVQDEPPGFATWTWTAQLDVTDAADTPT
jgi:hypothetical protein